MFGALLGSSGFFAAVLLYGVLPAQAAVSINSNVASNVSGHHTDRAVAIAPRSGDPANSSPMKLAAIQPTHITGGVSLAPMLKFHDDLSSSRRGGISAVSPQSSECGWMLLIRCQPPDTGEKPKLSLPASSTLECTNHRCDNPEQAGLKSGSAIEPCRDAPWRDCREIQELPGTAVPHRESVEATTLHNLKVHGLVDQMVREARVFSTPQSVLALRSVGYHVPRGNIIILTSERRLLYFFQDSIAVEFTIGIARRNLQRLGQTRIVLKRHQPTWVPTALQRRVYRGLPGSVGPGPKNPLGTRALNLTIPNIRIHGTNDDKTIGEAMSDGCFHMYNRDIEFLYENVSVGTKVTILR